LCIDGSFVLADEGRLLRDLGGVGAPPGPFLSTPSEPSRLYAR
jgi:hypothetical protein